MNQTAKNILKASNIKVTRQRLEVLDELLQSDVCLSAEEIYNRLIVKNVDINLATIYRIMDNFFEKGIVEKNTINRKHFFELKKSNIHQHYFVCIKCNKKVNIVDCKINLIEKELNKRNFKVLSHNLEVYGICNSCGGKNNEKD